MLVLLVAWHGMRSDLRIFCRGCLLNRVTDQDVVFDHHCSQFLLKDPFTFQLPLTSNGNTLWCS